MDNSSEETQVSDLITPSEESIAVKDTELLLDLDEVSEVLPYTYEITAYGADFLVDGLVRRIQSQDIRIPVFGSQKEESGKPAGFQREYIWNKVQADRFIESLLLGLPVPGVFLVREPEGVLLVLDGHQRLITLKSFYEGIWRGKEFKLEYVQPRYVSLTYKLLDPEDRRRLDNSIIHATIVRQDQPNEDQSSIYLIFERLNSGGTILQPQEIRVALYHGPFAELLVELNDNEVWRALYGNKSTRMKDIELILRFFAMLHHWQEYRRPMKGFLNTYMARNKDFKLQSRDDLERVFMKTTDTILNTIGRRAFRPKKALNAAVVDSIMIGVAERLRNSGEPVDNAKASGAYDALLHNKNYQAAIERATADEESVRIRMTETITAFAAI